MDLARALGWPPTFNGILPGSPEDQFTARQAAWRRYDEQQEHAAIALSKKREAQRKK